jgi:hypothetical protein
MAFSILPINIFKTIAKLDALKTACLLLRVTSVVVNRMTTLVAASSIALHKAFDLTSVCSANSKLGFSAYILGFIDKGVQAMHSRLIVPIK